MYKKYDIEKFSSSDSISPSPSPGGNTKVELAQENDRINEENNSFHQENIDLKNDLKILNETIEDNEKRIKQLEDEAVKDEERISSQNELIDGYQKQLNQTNQLDKEEICSAANGYITLEEHRNKLSQGGNFVPDNFVTKMDHQNVTKKLILCNESKLLMENSIDQINNSNKFYKQRGFWITILVLFLIGSIAIYFLTSKGSSSSSSDFGDF